MLIVDETGFVHVCVMLGLSAVQSGDACIAV